MKVTDKQFNTFRHLVFKDSGINLHDGKRQLLQARLSKRLRYTGVDSVQHYLNILENDEGERIQFINAISTNHTYFFREDTHFQYLNKGHVNIWCAASSSGEEPYSILIYCLEKGFRPQILATDISTDVLEIGKSGVYELEKSQKIPLPVLKKYCEKGHGRWDGFFRIKQEVQKSVRFKRLNLITDELPDMEFNVIFCRNVMIYFNDSIKEKVVNKLSGALKVNGYFIIGGAESLNNLNHGFKYIRPSIYKKI